MKKSCKVIKIVTLIFVLTGCMKICTSIIIKNENNVSMIMDILYSREIIDTYNMDFDDFKDWFSNDEYQDSEIKNITGEKAYALTLTKNSLWEGMDTSSLGRAQYYIEKMKNTGLEMAMKIQIPRGITIAIVNEIERNTVVIDLLEIVNNSHTLATTTSTGIDPSNIIYLYAAIGVGIITIIAIAYVIISKKRKEIDHSNIITIEDPIDITSVSEEPIGIISENEVLVTSPIKPIEETANTTKKQKEETDN